MKDLKTQFINWLDTKPADGEYNFTNCYRCAILQFTDEVYGDTGFPIYSRVNNATGRMASKLPWTFGALRDRLVGNCHDD